MVLQMAKKVVLIEDDLDIQRIYGSKLETAGYEVLLAIDASQGFTLIKDVSPNIVLLDIMLPGKMNGMDLLKTLKESPDYKNIPVVVLTNLDTQKHEALKMGAYDYIIKANTNLNEIVAKVAKFAR
ncbi:hypothetical protein A3A75_04355 [Candidatus Woesebacteria bacterium RIFCSPLOWO2_01_FULL_39_10]|uniref:Response regulatory domain-containing protein n=2 Tax=Candidatus Woeseibacteriota TaxID=1752722 RepID=A0A1F8B2L6_9BACT|nr:MAG: hypothetical protein A3A75_04355 [Candidatus Woesebacteria bacterium RIFCSPLOWO2_01_FULL_39_10]